MNDQELNAAVREAIKALTEARTDIDQALARLQAVLGNATDKPVLSARDLARVQQVGEVAYQHLAQFESNGGHLTLGESLTIRRALFPDNIRSTANFFGIKDSGALFYRGTPYGKARNNSDPVFLTEEGKRIAGLWRELHTEPSTGGGK